MTITAPRELIIIPASWEIVLPKLLVKKAGYGVGLLRWKIAPDRTEWLIARMDHVA